MVMVLTDKGQLDLASARAQGDDLWLSDADTEAVTGWSIKPEGFCRGDVCIPVPSARAAEFARPGQVNAATFWRHLGNPVLHDASASTWYLGEGAGERGADLSSLVAPDFTLPDLDGRLHSLSDHRGKKVFLATWASW